MFNIFLQVQLTSSRPNVVSKIEGRLYNFAHPQQHTLHQSQGFLS